MTISHGSRPVDGHGFRDLDRDSPWSVQNSVEIPPVIQLRGHPLAVHVATRKSAPGRR
ncbi:MAG: hypothetical protein JNK99_05790 [Candidatus Accumulibacter sp.]|uniref:hypothetical protein n=1 Tax=Accumulibacter sp. TaxID=2053492 RepID=UPI001A401CC4|nr:hypothetical protein [Accumulibacter sp.]MBL8394254.1 hypothetical protein [Accumulibacter sp.]